MTQILICLQTRRQASLDVNPSLSTTRTNLEMPMDNSNQQSVSGYSMTSVSSIFRIIHSNGTLISVMYNTQILLTSCENLPDIVIRQCSVAEWYLHEHWNNDWNQSTMRHSWHPGLPRAWIQLMLQIATLWSLFLSGKGSNAPASSSNFAHKFKSLFPHKQACEDSSTWSVSVPVNTRWCHMLDKCSQLRDMFACNFILTSASQTCSENKGLNGYACNLQILISSIVYLQKRFPSTWRQQWAFQLLKLRMWQLWPALEQGKFIVIYFTFQETCRVATTWAYCHWYKLFISWICLALKIETI